MGRSLGLATYRALSRRAPFQKFSPAAPRPNCTLLWIHVAEPDNMLAIIDLAQRVCAARYGLNVLITLPDPQTFEIAVENWVPNTVIHLECVPNEHPDAVEAFWKYWAPDMAIWTWGNLRSNLLDHVHQNKCPIILIDADAAGFDRRSERWFSNLTRELLYPFLARMVRSNTALHRLENLGLSKDLIEVTPPLQAGGQALPYQDSDLVALSETMRGRPVWLASNIQDGEIDVILTAHRQAVRLYHRLLLILHPANGSLVGSFGQKVASEGFRMMDWSAGEEPDDATQILLVPDHHDLGLFYRVAPVSFMGSSLVQGYGGRNPFDAAALGSAVLYGPNVRRFMPFYSRLAKAGAARIVKDSDTLGAAVAQLIAPDQAATMAHAGWDVVSQGAGLTDRVIELVHAALDGELEAPRART